MFALQQRAPVRVGRQAAFAKDLVSWARSKGVAKVLVLTGLDATLRKDRQLIGPAMRCVGLPWNK